MGSKFPALRTLGIASAGKKKGLSSEQISANLRKEGSKYSNIVADKMDKDAKKRKSKPAGSLLSSSKNLGGKDKLG